MFSFLLRRELGLVSRGNRCAKCKMPVYLPDCYACHDCGRVYCVLGTIYCFLKHLNIVCLRKERTFWIMNKDSEWEEFRKNLDERHLLIRMGFTTAPLTVAHVFLCATCHIRRIEQDLSSWTYRRRDIILGLDCLSEL